MKLSLAGSDSQYVEGVESVSGELVRGRRVVLAIGRMGNPRRLNVPGEDSARGTRGLRAHGREAES